MHLVVGPQFTSDELKQFLKTIGSQRTFSAPYHQANNPLAEGVVRTLKGSIKAMDRGDIHRKIVHFALDYRNAAHAINGSSPAELFLGCTLGTLLDLAKPDSSTVAQQKQQQMSGVGLDELDLVAGVAGLFYFARIMTLCIAALC